MFSRFVSALAIVSAVSLACFAEEDDRFVSISTEIGLEWNFQQIVKSSNIHITQNLQREAGWLNGFWMQDIKTILPIDARLGKNLRVYLRYYGMLGFGFPSSSDIENVQNYKGGSGIEEAYAMYRFGEAPDSSSPAIQIGLFPFEYSHPWQQLGGYLFRTGIYPGYISPTYNNYVRLQGLHVTASLPAAFRHDLFATFASSGNMSLSYVGSLRAHAFEANVGFFLGGLLRTNQSSYNYMFTNRSFEITSGSNPGNLKYYPTSGIKAMGRVSIDVGSLLGERRFLGPNDLELYAEAAILGLVDIGGYYDDITERVPGMVGLTFPSFGLVDAFGAEVEYYGSRWRNYPSGMAVPFQKFDLDDFGQYAEVIDPANENGGSKAYSDNWKWGVFAEKTVLDRLVISLRAASDHFNPGAGEVLHAPDEWYWQMTLKTLF